MALPTCNEDMNIISKLDDEPNDVGGLSATSLKAKFDLAGNLLKKALNDLVAALGENAAAKNIGFTPTTAVNKDNVQDAIENVQSQIAGVSQAGIADGAVTAAKIADGAVGTAAIADDAITAGKLAMSAVDTDAIKWGAVDTYRLKDGAVTEAKLSNGVVTKSKIGYYAVEERHIKNYAVTGDKIASHTIGSSKIGERAIVTSALCDEAVTTEKLATKCVTKEKVDLESLVTHVGYSSDGAAGRTINVGGAGILLFIYGNSKYGFVFPWGSVYAAYGTATWQWQDKADIKFENGVLTFVTANAWANEAGHTFVYQML
nr:MAG TPA: Putative tail protein [Caudoviricetes sp.]